MWKQELEILETVERPDRLERLDTTHVPSVVEQRLQIGEELLVVLGRCARLAQRSCGARSQCRLNMPLVRPVVEQPLRNGAKVLAVLRRYAVGA
jgi:hypothetical protein